MERKFEEIRKNVEAILGDGKKVILQPMIKNNNVLRHAIVIKDANLNLAPAIYIDEMEGTVGEITSNVIDIYNSSKEDLACKNLPDFINYEEIKDKIIYCLVNFKANEEQLKIMPHRIVFNDLAVIYKILVDKTEDMISAVNITDSMMGKWGITEKDLFNIANINTPKIMPYRFSTLKEVLIETGLVSEEFVEQYGDNLGMYVLSNKGNIFGATSLLYPGVIESIANKLNADLLILPSSIHEVIIVPMIDLQGDEEINSLINETNVTKVEENEVLSNHSYKYFRNE